MVSKKRLWNSRGIALAAVIAATYAAYVIIFGFVSFAIIQFRVVDALLPLSVLFGFPAVVGVTVGVFLGNFFSPFSLGPIDVVGGTLANLIAATLGWWIGRRRSKGAWLAAITAEIVVVTVVVGSYVVFLTTPGGIPLWVGWVTFLAGEVVPIGMIGYPLLRVIDKTTLAREFE